MSNSPARLRNICKAIDMLVVQVSVVPKKLGEDLKAIAAYLLEVESMPAKIEQQRANLAACATPSKEIIADSAKLVKRMRDNWECSLKSDVLVAELRSKSKHVRQTGLSNAGIEREIAAFVVSSKERRATHLELWADYVALVQADRYRREAKAIREEIVLAKLVREQDELNGRLDEAISLAEEVAMDLDRRARNRKEAIAKREQEAAEAARIAEAKAAEAAAKATATTVVPPQPLPQIAKTPEVDAGLVAYMKLEDLDPENPDDVALAVATASQSDIATARELFTQS